MSDGLMAVLALLAAGEGHIKPREKITLVENPRHTDNHFGPMSDIAGKTLTVLERNSWGCCLCVGKNDQGEFLIDVDKRDIVRG